MILKWLIEKQCLHHVLEYYKGQQVCVCVLMTILQKQGIVSEVSPSSHHIEKGCKNRKIIREALA